MTPIAKILTIIVVAAALGSTAWFLHAPTATNPQVATTTPDTGFSTTTVTTTTSTTTSTKPAPPVTKPPVPIQTPKPAPSHGLSISSITPSEGPVGTTVTMTGYGFTQTSQVMIGTNAAIANVTVNGSGTRLTFTMPNSAGAYCTADRPCAMYLMLISPGTYQLSVRNTDGANSNTVSFTLTGADTTFQ